MMLLAILLCSNARSVSATSSGGCVSWRARWSRGGHRKIERRAAADPALGPHATSMPIDDPMNCCQSDSRTSKFSVAVQPLKRLKQLLHICHVEPRAVVADEIDEALIAVVAATFNPGLSDVGGELPRIAEQILQHHAHEPA